MLYTASLSSMLELDMQTTPINSRKEQRKTCIDMLLQNCLNYSAIIITANVVEFAFASPDAKGIHRRINNIFRAKIMKWTSTVMWLFSWSPLAIYKTLLKNTIFFHISCLACNNYIDWMTQFADAKTIAGFTQHIKPIFILFHLFLLLSLSAYGIPFRPQW